MTALPLLLTVALVAVALYLLLVARRARRVLPRGTVVYSDADGQGRPLLSPHRPLSGKPDYVIQRRRGDHVPVELKSYRRGAQAPHGDLIQLGAYLVLLEDLHGRPPPFGILRYKDRAVRVPYTRELRAEVLRVLDRVQSHGAAPPPGTPHPALCRACPFAPICEMAGE
jgi:CRISPR-associated exonuclease Cas4